MSVAGRKDAYYVRSQSSDHAFKVQKNSDNKWSCDCPDFVKNSNACKHVFAVQYWRRLPRIAGRNGYIIFEKDMTKNGTCT